MVLVIDTNKKRLNPCRPVGQVHVRSLCSAGGEVLRLTRQVMK